MPGRRMRRSAGLIVVSLADGRGLGLRRQVSGRRVRRSARLVLVVSYRIGLTLGQDGRICHSAQIVALPDRLSRPRHGPPRSAKRSGRAGERRLSDRRRDPAGDTELVDDPPDDDPGPVHVELR
jgi:hypothetical protein